MSDEYVSPPRPADLPAATVKAAESFIRGIFYNADDWPLDEHNAAKNIARHVVSATLPIDGPERDGLVMAMARAMGERQPVVNVENVAAAYDALRTAVGAAPTTRADKAEQREALDGLVALDADDYDRGARPGQKGGPDA